MESFDFKKIYLSICFSGWGKVSASRATTRLISSIYKEKEIDFLLFTGVAGAAKNNLKQWDIIISDSVVQHDMDASPIFDRYVVPALKTKKIEPSRELLINFENSLIDLKIKGRLSKFGNVYKGLLATGDQFITDKKLLNQLHLNLRIFMQLKWKELLLLKLPNRKIWNG